MGPIAARMARALMAPMSGSCTQKGSQCCATRCVCAASAAAYDRRSLTRAPRPASPPDLGVGSGADYPPCKPTCAGLDDAPAGRYGGSVGRGGHPRTVELRSAGRREISDWAGPAHWHESQAFLRLKGGSNHGVSILHLTRPLLEYSRCWVPTSLRGLLSWLAVPPGAASCWRWADCVSRCGRRRATRPPYPARPHSNSCSG